MGTFFSEPFEEKQFRKCEKLLSVFVDVSECDVLLSRYKRDVKEDRACNLIWTKTKNLDKHIQKIKQVLLFQFEICKSFSNM